MTEAKRLRPSEYSEDRKKAIREIKGITKLIED
jgi:hypothetical protein